MITVKHRILVSLWISAILVACGPSQAELDAQATKIAADIFATQTADAPTPTPTFTPTSTPTFTPTSTPTPIPTSTPTSTPTIIATLPPLPAGWTDHAASGFHIALPERWEAVDVDEEGIEAIWSLLEGIKTEWAQNATAMFSSEAVQELIKFWAIDSEPAGTGYANINISSQSQPFSIKVDDLCTLFSSVYEQTGVEMVDAECDLQINELNAARFMIRLQIGPLAIMQYQYVFVQERDMWTLSLGVDETEWSEYEPIFATIAESFRVD